MAKWRNLNPVLTGDILPNVATKYRLDSLEIQNNMDMALSMVTESLTNRTYQHYYAQVKMMFYAMRRSKDFQKDIDKLRKEFKAIPSTLDGKGLIVGDLNKLEDFAWKISGIIAKSGHNDFKRKKKDVYEFGAEEEEEVSTND